MIRCDVFICNPPYNNCQKHNGNILEKITEKIRYKQPKKIYTNTTNQFKNKI